jgi:hypothetical protein
MEKIERDSIVTIFSVEKGDATPATPFLWGPHTIQQVLCIS